MAYLSYDILSERYDELYGEEQVGKYKNVVKIYGGNLGVVLDAGCGTGLFLEYVKHSREVEYLLYVGVDISLGMLRIARLRKDNTSDFIYADVHKLPFRDKCFDTTVSITVIHHLNHKIALEEMKRVTRCRVIVTQNKMLDDRCIEGEKYENIREAIYIISP